MYVLKFAGKYCKFGSYSKIHLVDQPHEATLYPRESDLKKRIGPSAIGRHYSVYGTPEGRVRIEAKLLKPARVEFEWTEYEA